MMTLFLAAIRRVDGTQLIATEFDLEFHLELIDSMAINVSVNEIK